MLSDIDTVTKLSIRLFVFYIDLELASLIGLNGPQDIIYSLVINFTVFHRTKRTRKSFINGLLHVNDRSGVVQESDSVNER